MKFIEAENRGPEESGSQYLMSEEVIKYEVPINIKLTCNTKQKTIHNHKTTRKEKN